MAGHHGHSSPPAGAWSSGALPAPGHALSAKAGVPTQEAVRALHLQDLFGPGSALTGREDGDNGLVSSTIKKGQSR